MFSGIVEESAFAGMNTPLPQSKKTLDCSNLGELQTGSFTQAGDMRS